MPTGGSYLFNGRLLTEVGYYTTVYSQSDCDSVVGLTLTEPWGIEQIDVDEGWQTESVQIYDLTGRYVGNGLEHLAPGVYILRLTKGSAVTTKKIYIH